MRRTMKYLTMIISGIGLMMALASPAFSQQERPTEYIVDGKYEDVRFDLEDAIVSLGLKVDHISNVSNMLQRTAEVVPGAKQIYTTGQQFQLCSATLSRAAMQADPANIIFCPYMIYLYERVDVPGKIHIGYRKLEERGNEESVKAINAVNDLLDGIIKEASGN